MRKSLLRAGFVLFLIFPSLHSNAQLEFGVGYGLSLVDGEFSNFNLDADLTEPDHTIAFEVTYDYKSICSFNLGYLRSTTNLNMISDLEGVSPSSTGKLDVLFASLSYNLLNVNRDERERLEFGPSLGVSWIHSSITPSLTEVRVHSFEILEEPRSSAALILGAYVEFHATSNVSLCLRIQNHFVDDTIDGIIGTSDKNDFLMFTNLVLKYRFKRMEI